MNAGTSTQLDDRAADHRVATPILDILIVAAVSAAAYLAESLAHQRGIFPLGEGARGVSAVLAGAVAAMVLVVRRGGSLRELGFKRPRRWWTVPFWVVGILVAFVAAQNAVPAVLSLLIDLPAPDFSRYAAIAGDLRAALLMALALPITASIPEEILYRGFLMDRLTRLFGTGRGGAVLTVVAQSLIFGSIHFAWGLGGVIMATMMGVVWGAAFLLCGRNLWIVILAHSTAHLLFVAQLYAGPPA